MLQTFFTQRELKEKLATSRTLQWHSGTQGTWVLGHLGTRASEALGHSKGTWHSGTQDTWALGHQGTQRALGHSGTWALKHLRHSRHFI